MTMESTGEEERARLPRKRARMDCAIHCSDDAKLVSPQNIESWRTLLRAAEIRKHAPILNMAKYLPEGEIPPVQYHRKCRSIFTMKKLLDSIIAREDPRGKTAKDTPRRSSREAPSTSRVYDEQCIFCEKASKYLRGQNTREPLTQCAELRADDRIRAAAVRKLDNRMLAVVSRNLVAAEGHYHKSCYLSYTKDHSTSGNIEGEEQGEDIQARQYEAAEKHSYSELFRYIRNELFPNPEVLPLRDLTSKLVTCMNSCGISQVKDSTKKHLRRKLEAEFAGALHIFPDSKGKVLLYPDSLSMSELAKVTYALKVELHNVTFANTGDVITKAALKMRDDIKKQDVTQIWPPDVEHSDGSIPESVTKLLKTMLTGEKECTDPSQRVTRLVSSFGQDLVYGVSGGKNIPAKHILLPFAVKSLTGNVELISTLNRLGHSTSYSKVEEIDTALCLQKLALSESAVALPGNIYPSVFTTLAWDNIDRLEETVSGEGTSHRVNGIAVQAKVIGPQPLKVTPTVAKTKKRSISAAPLMLATYNAGKRVGPSTTTCVDADTTAVVQDARRKNNVWLLARRSDPGSQTVSSWTGFNIRVRDQVPVIQDNIGYLPTINAPATQMSTVNEVLNQSLSIMQSLQLTKIICVFDQALYAKAAEIAWKHEDKFKNIILRMGAFHTICNLLSTIGKRFQDAGLRDLCVESGVIAEGSIAGVMEGRKYNRGVRLHKLVYEALMRLAWKGFLPWLEENHIADLRHLEETLTSISNFCDNICQMSFKEVLENTSCVRTMELFQVYLNYLRDGNGDLSAFWMSYVDMVEIMLALLRASREGDWMLHLASIREMIPWCFAYDKLNYARFLPYYYAQMSRLPLDHPEVHAHFMEGGFSVQIGTTNPFGRIPVDQTIEETVNKDTQTPGGTKGFSLKPGAVTRYYLTSDYRSMYLGHLRDMVGRSHSQLNHPDLQLPRIRRDEADIQSLVDLMENSWLDPLSPDQAQFVSLSTATVAPPDVANDLLAARTVGEEAYQDFKKKRLETNPPTAQFNDKMTKRNLKTFTHIRKKPTSKAQAKEIVLKADRNLFGHMILVAQSRDLHMRDVLAHPLGPLPWSIANGDGSLRKTNKATLARELEKSVSPAEVIAEPSATVIDGMSLVQKMKGNDKTFSQLAEAILSTALHDGAQSKRIDVVFDVYRETSIKDAERCNRGASTAIQFRSIAPGHNIQQWRKLLCSSSNKASLIKFLVEEWKEPKSREKLKEKLLYVTCEEVCYKLTKDHWEEVAELKSTQEEADTRMLLHALHAAEAGYKAVVITAEDTDVLVLCLAFNKDIPCPVYQKCGTQTRTRFLDIDKLARSMGDSVCDALVGLHVFSGCDTVSAFAGRGKMGALKQMKSDKTYQEAFSQLGHSWEVSTELFQKLQEVTCHMYVPSTNTTKVNELRHQLFCARRGEIESSQLPPCEDCLFMHVLRANYQAAIWRRCLQCQPYVPSPKGCGWTTDDDGKLAIEWMQGSPAPDAVLQLLSCKCGRSCKLPDCTCLANSLKCTDMCKLRTCSNQPADVEEEVVDLEDSDADNSDED